MLYEMQASEHTSRPAREITGAWQYIAFLAAYIDTLHIFIAGPPEPGDRRYLELIYGRRIRMVMTRRWNPMTFRMDIIGFTVKVQCPQVDMLDALGAMQRERGGSIRRLDVSFDWRSDHLSSIQLTKWIKEHLLMRNRESGIMNTYENGAAYFVPAARLAERSIDNLVYFDRVSKLDRSGPPVAKNEPRIRGAENIKRVYRVVYADEIKFINPDIVFARCFDISKTFDSKVVAKAVQKSIRANVRARRKALVSREHSDNFKPTKRSLARLETLRAMLAKREARLWANRDLDFIQRVKDFFPRLLIPSNGEIRVASRLSWGAKGSRQKPMFNPAEVTTFDKIP